MSDVVKEISNGCGECAPQAFLVTIAVGGE